MPKQGDKGGEGAPQDDSHKKNALKVSKLLKY